MNLLTKSPSAPENKPVRTAPASTTWPSTNAPTPASATQTQHVVADAVSAILMPQAKVTASDLAHVLAPMDVARTRTVRAQFV
jgi:hypothetical protein